MNKLKLRPLALCLVAVATSCAALAGCSSSDEGSKEQPRPAYVVDVRASVGDERAFIGTVRATQRAELAFPVSGKVSAVLVEPGDRFLAGQVLARLDPLPFSAQAASASGDVAKAEAALAEVRRRVERLDVAQKSDALSPGEMTAARSELAAAEAAVRNARAQQDLANWSQKEAVLKAAFDGVVAARHIEVGQAAGPAAPAITVDGSGRELSVLIPGTTSLKVGQEIQLRSEGQTTASKVLRVDGRVNAGGVRTAYVSVPDGAVVGSTWSVEIGGLSPAASAGVVQVPLRAVLPSEKSGKGHVLRVGKDGKTTELAEVTIGALHGDWVEIMSGLNAGQQVVVAGAKAIRPGAKITPVKMKDGRAQ